MVMLISFLCLNSASVMVPYSIIVTQFVALNILHWTFTYTHHTCTCTVVSEECGSPESKFCPLNYCHPHWHEQKAFVDLLNHRRHQVNLIRHN